MEKDKQMKTPLKTTLTARERAENIFHGWMVGQLSKEETIEMITSEINDAIEQAVQLAEWEAVEKAREEMTNGEGKSVFWAKAYDQGYKEGAEAMREMAARVADIYCDEKYTENNTAWTVRNEIRALPSDTTESNGEQKE